MPKLKKGLFEKAMDMLSGLIEMHQKVDDMSNATMAHLIRPGSSSKPGMNERTFRNKVLDPETFTVRELAITMRRLHFTEEEVMEWVRLILRGE